MRLSLRWQLGLLIPCAALAAASLHAVSGQAGPRHHRMHEPWSQLTQAQQQALFKVRRDWELRSYPQRLALLKNRQLCLKDAGTLEAYRSCRRQSSQARQALRRQGRTLINGERKRLGLAPLPERRSWHHRPQKSRP